MRISVAIPAVICALSAAVVTQALMDPVDEDLALIFGIVTLLSGLSALRRLRRPRAAQDETIILDGSNVMYWDNETPSLGPIEDVLKLLHARGYAAGVMFDANAGYLLFDKYCGHHDFARLLKLPPDRVLVAPKGTPADPIILKAATDLNARVVTNDRYRDWATEFPIVEQPGVLISGRFRAGEVVLDKDIPQAAPQT